LDRAIRALFKQTYAIFSIIIVVNNSTDRNRTWDEAQALAKEFPNVVFALNAGIIKTKKAGALNFGLDSDCPKGQFIVEMDSDTILEPDAVEKLLSNFWDPTVAVTCGQVLPQPWTGKEATWCWKAKLVEYLLGQGLTKKAQNHFGAVLVMCGCFAIFESSLHRQVLATKRWPRICKSRGSYS